MWACKVDIEQYDFYLQHTHGSQIERYDLIVLHSWTFLAVTLADAKVVKHVESVMLKNRANLENILSYLLSPVNLDELLEEHNSSCTVAFCIKWRRPGCKSHHIWDNHQY